MSYTKEDLPEAQVALFLDAESLFTGYTKQLMLFKEPATATERVILIKVDGSSAPSTEDHQFPSMMVVVFGAVNDTNISDVKLRAEDIAKKLRNQGSQGRTVGIQNPTNVFGPFLSDSGRPWFEIDFTLVLSEEI